MSLGMVRIVIALSLLNLLSAFQPAGSGFACPWQRESPDVALPPGVPVPACDAGALQVRGDGVAFLHGCYGAGIQLLPAVQIASIWRFVEDPERCDADPDGGMLRCDIGAWGTGILRVDQGELSLGFLARQPAEVTALAAVGTLSLPGGKAWLSNGFQSWSQSGVIAVGPEPSATALNRALSARGEEEVYRRGTELSWWHTFVGGGDVSFFAGAITAHRFRSWAQVYRHPAPAPSSDPILHIRLVSGGSDEVLLHSGQRLDSETWQLALGTDLEAMQRRYAANLPSQRWQEPRPAPAGWNSWYDLWDDVREADIVSAAAPSNADWVQDVLGPHLPANAEPMFVVIDDGWQRSWGDWEANRKFPSGIPGVAQQVHDRGLRLGLWMAPLLVAPGSDVAKAHPDWLVQGARYQHPVHGSMGVLDVTHPEAARHLEDIVARAREWGVELLKIDFLFAGTWSGDRVEHVTGIEAYHRALTIIREAAGPEVFLLAVGAPPLPTLAYADGWRVGNDIAFKPLPIVDFPQPTWSFIANQARQFTSRWPYCLATLCDGDPALLRVLPRDEVEAGVWVAMASGGAAFVSDDLNALALERRGWGLSPRNVAHGVGGEPATPERFYPAVAPQRLHNMKDRLFTAPHHIPSVWRYADGTRLAFNFLGSDEVVQGVLVPSHSVRELPPAAGQ